MPREWPIQWFEINNDCNATTDASGAGNAGHLPWLEAPDEFYSALPRFLHPPPIAGIHTFVYAHPETLQSIIALK